MLLPQAPQTQVIVIQMPLVSAAVYSGIASCLLLDTPMTA